MVPVICWDKVDLLGERKKRTRGNCFVSAFVPVCVRAPPRNSTVSTRLWNIAGLFLFDIDVLLRWFGCPSADFGVFVCVMLFCILSLRAFKQHADSCVQYLSDNISLLKTSDQQHVHIRPPCYCTFLSDTTWTHQSWKKFWVHECSMRCSQSALMPYLNETSHLLGNTLGKENLKVGKFKLERRWSPKTRSQKRIHLPC